MLTKQLQRSIPFPSLLECDPTEWSLGYLSTGMLYFHGLVASAQWQLEGMIFYHIQNHLIKVVRTFLILSCY